MDATLIREIVGRHRAGERFAVGLLVAVQGSAPQKAGARLLVLPDGAMRGTVGGGCLEMEARRRALLAMPDGATEIFDLRLDDDFGWDDGLICGGKTRLLVCAKPERMADALAEALAIRQAGGRCRLETRLDGEAAGETRCRRDDRLPPTPIVEDRRDGPWLVEGIRPDPTLVVCGCGHIGAALVGFAARVGFRVTAVDDRAAFADAHRLPDAETVVCDDLPAAAATLPSDDGTYWVVVTRGHRNDGKVVDALLHRPFAYIGMIGSRRKVRLIKEGLRAAGHAPERVARLHAPIGLDIGAQTPAEIALAIAAQLVQVRRRSGG